MTVNAVEAAMDRLRELVGVHAEDLGVPLVGRPERKAP